MKTKIYLTAVAMAAIALFSGCAKDGATGPAGPAGTNGTANISTSTFTATPGSWSNPSSGVYTVSASDATITNADNDLVQVYAQTTSGGAYFPLPENSFLVNGDVMTNAYSNGTVTVAYLYSAAPTSSILFKVVVIPPAARMANPNVNLKSYAEVKAAFNLQD